MHESAPLYGASEQQKRIVNLHATTLSALVVTPFLTYVTVFAAFTFVYGDSTTVTWLWVAVCAGMSLFLVCTPSRRPDTPLFYIQLGSLCLLAAALGTGLGLLNWDRNMSRDAAYAGQRLYSNVLPTEPALSHLDAGKIVFSSDSTLNVAKAVGYKSGAMYCVAPVIDATAKSKTKVEYFAAGVDCCEARGSFTCDEASDKEVHAGLVYLQLDGDLLKMFGKAAQEAAAQHGITVSEDALFVRWVRDPDKFANGYDNAGIGFFLISSLIVLVLFTIAGFAIHFGQRNRTRITKSAAV